MLFPSGDPHPPSPRTCLELDDDAGRPAPGHLGRPRRVRHAVRRRRADARPQPRHAAARRARRRPLHAAAPARPPPASRRRRRSGLDDELRDPGARRHRPRPAPAGDRQARRARDRPRARVAGRRVAAGPLDADQHRRLAVRRGRARGRAAGRRPPHASRSTSPGGTSASAPRSAGRSPTGSGCARAATAGPASTPPRMVVLGHARLRYDGRRGDGRARRLERQLACSASSATRPPVRRSAAASCCSPARWCSAAARATRPRGSTSPRPTTGSTGWRPPGTPGSGRCRPTPTAQPVVLNVWEAVYFDHDLQRLLGDRRPGGPRRRRAVRARRRVVPPAPRRHRRARRLVDRRERLARRADAARSSTCAGWAWSSGCGSSPRWSTPTPTCYRTHPDWILAAGPFRAPLRAAAASRCST